MLACLPDRVLRERLGQAPLPRLTRHGVGSAAVLLRQLQSVRRQGFAIDDEETAEGMQCFGAAIHDASAEEAGAAVAVSVIKAGLTAARREELIAGIQALASAISIELGAPSQGHPPS
jgi:DNA-binding IclR family transcriptional regulator